MWAEQQSISTPPPTTADSVFLATGQPQLEQDRANPMETCQECYSDTALAHSKQIFQFDKSQRQPWNNIWDSCQPFYVTQAFRPCMSVHTHEDSSPPRNCGNQRGNSYTKCRITNENVDCSPYDLYVGSLRNSLLFSVYDITVINQVHRRIPLGLSGFTHQWTTILPCMQGKPAYCRSLLNCFIITSTFSI